MENQTPHQVLSRSGKTVGQIAVNSHGKMWAEWVIVTPELAAEWLENHNHVNRRERAHNTDRIVEEMEEGRWIDTGDPFQFDWDDETFNGAHRMRAIVTTGIPQEFLIVHGVDPQARTAVDAHARRRFADDLTLAGKNQGILREALVRQMVKWDKNGGLADTHWNATRTYLGKRYGLYDAELTETIQETMRWREVWGGNRVAMTFTYWLLRKRLEYDEKKVIRFFSVLAIGSQDPADAVLIRMKRKISESQGPKQNGKIMHMATPIEVWWLIAAWNRWITGNNAQFHEPKGGYSDPYPMPVKPGEGK